MDFFKVDWLSTWPLSKYYSVARLMFELSLSFLTTEMFFLVFENIFGFLTTVGDFDGLT